MDGEDAVTTNKIDPPVENSEYTEYWQGTAEGRLVAQHCLGCDRWQWPGRDACLACGAPTPEWAEVPRRGRVHTYLVVNRAFHPSFADDVPFTLVVVEVLAGVRYLGRLAEARVGGGGAGLIGATVEARFRPVGRATLVDWALADD
jgi:uncharacterized protein